MEQMEEKRIFDAATEKLDLYVPFLLKYNHIDEAKEFLRPGGQYVRFAVKQLMKELLGELIKPVGEYKKEAAFVDMEPIFETVRNELPEHYQVRHEMTGDVFSEFIEVKISDILHASARLFGSAKSHMRSTRRRSYTGSRF